MKNGLMNCKDFMFEAIFKTLSGTYFLNLATACELTMSLYGTGLFCSCCCMTYLIVFINHWVYNRWCKMMVGFLLVETDSCSHKSDLEIYQKPLNLRK